MNTCEMNIWLYLHLYSQSYTVKNCLCLPEVTCSDSFFQIYVNYFSEHENSGPLNSKF